MKLKRVTAVLLAGVMAMGLVACGSGSDTAADTTTSTSTATDTADDSESSDLLGSADATIHLKVGTTTAPDGHYVLGLVEMQKKLEEYSNGEMTLDIYPNSALGGESDMMDAVSMVKTGQVTYAVRDTRLDEKEIHEGDIMGIGDKGILAVGKGKENVAKEMVAAMVDEDSEVISIYYGAETTEEDAQALGEELEALYPDCEIEVNSGGQPIYYYIISVE